MFFYLFSAAHRCSNSVVASGTTWIPISRCCPHSSWPFVCWTYPLLLLDSDCSDLGWLKKQGVVGFLWIAADYNILHTYNIHIYIVICRWGHKPATKCMTHFLGTFPLGLCHWPGGSAREMSDVLTWIQVFIPNSSLVTHSQFWISRHEPGK